MPPDTPPSSNARTGAHSAALRGGWRAVRAWSGAADLVPGPHLDSQQIEQHNQRNRQHTWTLIGTMALMLVCAALLLAGWWGLLLATISLSSMILLGPRAAPKAVMQAYGGERVEPNHGGPFPALIAELSRRADLAKPPDLYVIPSAALNAFAVGSRADSALALTEGLIRKLDMRELAGVLAHEIAHIRNGDLWIMGLADGITRMARVLSLSAAIMIVLNVLSYMAGAGSMSWIGLILLYLMPMASSLLQQALSRTREFDADLDGITLTGDAEGLASALRKLDLNQGRPWEDLVFGNRRVPQPSILRSHPTTPERIARLLSYRPAPSAPRGWPKLAINEQPLITRHAGVGAAAMQPRYRWKSGVWY